MAPHSTPHLTILTGASRGMGLAMAKQLLQTKHHLLCVSRGSSEALVAQAARLNATLESWSVDLADASTVSARLRDWLAQHRPGPARAWGSVNLINNAGVISEIAPVGALSDEALMRSLRVGLEATMLLTNAFLQSTADWPVPRRVLNISSGLGRRPMASQAAYCAAKAGMDHFTRCVALEQAARAASGLPAARVCSLAPGVIDTDMQVQLRQADPDQFADREVFVGLQAQAQLATPEQAASRVLAWWQRRDFGDAAVADVRES